MKSGMLKPRAIATALAAVVVATGCNSPSSVVSGAGVATGGSSVASVAANGCSVGAIGGGAQISCADGSTAPVMNGTNGAAGATGATGPQGPAGSPLNVYDRVGFMIGTGIVNYSPDLGVGNRGEVTLVNGADHAIVTYNLADGTMRTSTLYYQALNCTGTPFVPYVPGNSVVANNGSYYKVQTTGAMSFAAASIWNPGAPCSNTAAASVYMFPAGAYTLPATVPAAASIPLSIQ